MLARSEANINGIYDDSVVQSSQEGQIFIADNEQAN